MRNFYHNLNVTVTTLCLQTLHLTSLFAKGISFEGFYLRGYKLMTSSEWAGRGMYEKDDLTGRQPHRKTTSKDRFLIFIAFLLYFTHTTSSGSEYSSPGQFTLTICSFIYPCAKS